MSAFLGPIHYWLYNKIQWHENLLDEIYGLMASNGEDVGLIKHYTEHQFGAPERSELSEVIDGSNIHGWLQTKIQSLEYRMAYVLTHIISKEAVSLESLKALYHENGKKAYERYQGSMKTPNEMFKAIYDYLLEGMPCDRVNHPISADEKGMVWVKKICIHTEYWNAVGGDIKNYDALRLEWLKGFVMGEFELVIEDGVQFILTRRAA
ncbi:MAG TPA: hypothetical protein DCS67_05725 [Clostridiales bacterium UBA8960]|jgi:hypothetical protein|nr:hypothetical protein [Clostridiales bacterium UBA8960]